MYPIDIYKCVELKVATICKMVSDIRRLFLIGANFSVGVNYSKHMFIAITSSHGDVHNLKP